MKAYQVYYWLCLKNNQLFPKIFINYDWVLSLNSGWLDLQYKLQQMPLRNLWFHSKRTFKRSRIIDGCVSKGLTNWKKKKEKKGDEEKF